MTQTTAAMNFELSPRAVNKWMKLSREGGRRFDVILLGALIYLQRGW